jgi:transposase
MSSSKMYQSACKAARSLLASSSSAARSSVLAGQSVRRYPFRSKQHQIRSHQGFKFRSWFSLAVADGRNAALATLTNIGRTMLPAAYSYHTKASGAANAAHRYGWIAGIPAAGQSSRF